MNGGRNAARSAKEIRSNTVVVVCLVLLAAIALFSVIGPLVSSHNMESIDLRASHQAPTLVGGRIFGTDALGRDLFVRTMKGTQVTLLVAVVASLVSLIIGVTYGAVAGYIGGRLDAIMMRAVDVLYAMPFLFFVILLMVAFERSFFLIFVAIGAINWLDTARIVRGQTMSLKHRAFVDAARLTGVNTVGIITRHIAPNLLGVIIVYTTLTVPQVILFESFLSFLGLGVQAPQTSLGALVSDGVVDEYVAPWVLLFPAGFLALMLLCFNFLGDGLRDVFDPKSKVQ
jgi:oligopeptide transport system permease protein